MVGNPSNSEPNNRQWDDVLFPLLLALFVGGFAWLAILFGSREQPVRETRVESSPKRAQVYIHEKRKPQDNTIKPRVEKKIEKEVKSEPIDLTEKPVLAQKQEFKGKNSPAEAAKKAKPIYGLRKVYSKGLGVGGGMSDAIVGKLGNTLEKDFDTLIATENDIKGEVVSTTTVTRAPTFKKRVRPQYTQEMLLRAIEGVVRVKVLVDIDGKVKKAHPLNDLGGDAANQALKATLAMEFEPARRGETAVAVWIIVPIRFVMIG